MAALTDTLRPGIRFPEVFAERCVHSHLQWASCGACVECCPHRAWVLDDARLALDAARCDGCGLCVAACPQGALGLAVSAQTRALEEGALTLVACERAGPGLVGEAVVPCVHGLTLNSLLAAYRGGSRVLVVAQGECERCDRGGWHSLFDRLDRLNGLLRQRGLDSLDLRRVTAAQWQRVRDRSGDREAGPWLSRRQFLRTALHRAAEQVGARSEPAAMSFQPPGRYLPSRSGEVVIFGPEIDPGRCTGCGDCARICPQHAVQLNSGQGARGSLRTDPDLCTGCGLCRDLCSVGAIEILRWGVPRREEIPLTRSRCRACGAPYWHPPEGDPSSCPICRQRRHNDRLFQVLD